jgi:adenylate cyclase, class 2
VNESGATGAQAKDEVEVKLPAGDLDEVRGKLRGLAASPVSPLHFERNDLFDDDARRLEGAGAVLRLRQAGGEVLLTYKGRPHFEQGVKRREEREVRVSDAAEADAILRGIGLSRRFRYEKRREEWRTGHCLVALDETPIGSFVEVEGDPSEIRRVVVSLGLDFAAAIPYSYPRLYAMKRKEHPELPEEMVFLDRETEGGRR